MVGQCPTDQLAGETQKHKVGMVGSAPECWDGKNLDSPDHRSHMSKPQFNDSTGWKVRCPSTHPFLIPTFTMGAWYTIDDDFPTWELASDDMTAMGMGKQVRGSTGHADWFGAWDDLILKAWTDNCIDRFLNCSGADLGNGRQLKMFEGFSWTAEPRLVDPPVE
jgi:hypothetical protein